MLDVRGLDNTDLVFKYQVNLAELYGHLSHGNKEDYDRLKPVCEEIKREILFRLGE